MMFKNDSYNYSSEYIKEVERAEKEHDEQLSYELSVIYACTDPETGEVDSFCPYW